MFFLISGVPLTTWRSSLQIIYCYSLSIIRSITYFHTKTIFPMFFLTSVLWKLGLRVGLVTVEERKVSCRLPIIELRFFVCPTGTPVTTSNNQPRFLINKIVDAKNVKSVTHSFEIPFQYLPVGTEKN